MHFKSSDCRSTVAVAMCLAFLAGPCAAFKLRPEGTPYDRDLARLDHKKVGALLDEMARRGIDLVAEPVHEEITHRAFHCPGVAELLACANDERRKPRAPDSVIDGLRWNDNPPFQIHTRPTTYSLSDGCLNQVLRIPRKALECWKPVFDAAKNNPLRRAYTASNGAALVQRSHFGDLQFLHGMATNVYERASDTRANILAWAQFTFGVFRGAYGKDHYLTKCPRSVRDSECKLVGIPLLSRWFPGEMSVANLFTQGDETHRDNLREVALGSILHIIQDSFSEAHVTRLSNRQNQQCGPASESWQSYATIQMFLTYGVQIPGEHAKRDDARAFAAGLIKYRPNVIQATSQVKALFETARDWDHLKSFLEDCMFDLENPEAESGGGAGLERSD